MYNNNLNVKQHEQKHTFTEDIIIPDHEKRAESKEFSETKAKLKKDNHYECWICGTKDDLQVHHFSLEWCLQNDCDFDELKKICETFDIYGYAKEMKDIPMTSVDDIRNMMVLCQHHHTHPGTSIHDLTFPVFIAQKACKIDPVPQK